MVFSMFTDMCNHHHNFRTFSSLQKETPNVYWCSLYGKQYGGSSKKLNIELPYDPAIPFLGIYLEKTIIQKDSCIPMFIAALFTIANLKVH